MPTVNVPCPHCTRIVDPPVKMTGTKRMVQYLGEDDTCYLGVVCSHEGCRKPFTIADDASGRIRYKSSAS